MDHFGKLVEALAQEPIYRHTTRIQNSIGFRHAPEVVALEIQQKHLQIIFSGETTIMGTL